LPGSTGNKIVENRIKNWAKMISVTNAAILLLEYNTGKLTGTVSTQRKIISNNNVVDDCASPSMTGIQIAGQSDYNAILIE